MQDIEQRLGKMENVLKAGVQIALARRLKRETMQDVSKEIGISKTYISEIERGTKIPAEDVLEKICKHFGLDRMKYMQLYGRIPAGVTADLLTNPELARLLEQISNGGFTPEEKNTMYHKTVECVKKSFKL